MEIRLLDKEELWSVLSTDDLYHTHVVLSAQQITSPLPSVDVKTLPLSWIFDPSKVSDIVWSSFLQVVRNVSRFKLLILEIGGFRFLNE